VLTNRKNGKPYLAFKQLEEQVHSQLMGAAAAAGCGLLGLYGHGKEPSASAAAPAADYLY
jgi:hypothetical protein